jgi:hypothetical protein
LSYNNKAIDFAKNRVPEYENKLKTERGETLDETSGGHK